MTEEVMGGIVCAAECALMAESPAAAGALLCRLGEVKRFDMLWMMSGGGEKAAAQRVFTQAAAVADAEALPALKKGAARFDAKL